MAGLALLGVLAVAACEPGEDPSDPPTTSAEATTTADDPTTSESPTDVATPPEVEAPTPAPEASVDDHVGAIYSARYFLDLYTYMRATGDTAQFEAMSAEECEFCTSQAEAAAEIYEEGGWIEGGGVEFDIEAATADYPTEDEPNYLVRFDMTELPIQIHRSDGTVDDIDGSDYQVVIAMQFENGRFIVHGVNAE